MSNPTQQEITTLLTAIDQTRLAVAFSETVVMEVDETPIEGTKYKYILTIDNNTITD